MQNIDVRNINIGQLQCFILTAELNSFTKAAEQMHITQSTVSKAISAMENMMGLQLFIRKGNRIRLTPAGRHVYDNMKDLGRDVEKTLYAASVIQTGLNKNVRIACLDSYKPDSVVIPIVNGFKKNHPDIKVAVETMPAQDIRTSLIKGDTDIVFTVLYDIEELGSDPFETLLIAECPHCAFMLPTNPLRKKKHLKVSDLKQSEFISISPLKTPSYSISINRLCEENGFHPNVSYFTQSAGSLAFNLTTDNEIFIADRFYKDYDNPSLVPVPLENTHSGLVMGYHSPIINNVTKLFIEYVSEYLKTHKL
ncbi:MAG: LysR family transcriptional regulator [Parasporobacterium sp.]|nr:LysR family transcriptional regulator [Parasporobacterium sp.]